MMLQRLEVKAIVNHDRNHSRAAVGAGNFHAVGRRIDNARAIHHRLGYLGGRDIFSLPAKGTPDPIDKMKIAAFVELHQIAGTKPGIPFREYIAQDLLFSRGGVGIALEAATSIIGRSDAPDGFADIAAGASDTKSVQVANGNAKLGVDTNDRGWKTMRQQGRNPADRTRPSFDV